MPITHRLTKPLSTPSPARLYGAKASQIESYWPQVLPLINSALEYSDKYTSQFIYESLKSRDMQLWLSIDGEIEACCITRIENFPTGKVCTIFLVAGKNMDHWLRFEEQIERWAKSQGCQSIEAYGRPGWVRVTGWEQIHVVIRKRIN
jgi:hypothetical protein